MHVFNFTAESDSETKLPCLKKNRWCLWHSYCNYCIVGIVIVLFKRCYIHSTLTLRSFNHEHNHFQWDMYLLENDCICD